MTDSTRKSGSILVVEDEGVVAMDIQRCLTEAGLEVIAVAASAQDAILETERMKPDLVLMDIRIQGDLDGVETAELLQRRFRVPTVYLTAQGDSRTIERVKRTHPLSFLQKPFRESELLTTVEIALERARSERELEQREQAFATALDSIGDAVISTDEDGRIRYINSAAELLTGWQREAALGCSLAEVLPRVQTEAGESPIGEAGEFQIRTPRGQPRWVVERPAQMDQVGELSARITVLQDVTAWKRTELVLHRQAGILEQLREAVFTSQAGGAISFWNRGAERLYGFTQQEAVGKSPDVLLRTEFPRGRDALENALARDRKWTGELVQTAKDGRRIVVDCSMAIEEGRGTVIHTNRDITERRHAEEQLARSEERYRSLALVTSQIVWITGPMGALTGDAPQWREFTAQSHPEMQGWGWLDALHPDDRDRTRDLWERSVKNRSFYNTEYRLRRHDGEYRWMAVHAVPVFNEQGEIREWIGTCADITDRVRAEEEIRELNLTLERRVADRTAELQAANRELEAFAYSVSHDLRAPLRAMDGFSRILVEDHAPLLPDQARHYLEVVRENAVQMGKLIDALLAFSRLGRQPLSNQTVWPGDLVRELMAQFAEERDGRAVEVNVGELPACQGDPLLLRQVFFNLLSNAFKYTRKRGAALIQVGAFQFSDRERFGSKAAAPRNVSQDSMVYYVRDNGAGFDMRYADKLFGVFQRLHRAEEYEGTGVGLATVFRIVTRHGGQVWAESELNQGATFYFTLAHREPPQGGPSVDAGQRGAPGLDRERS